jgi:hypothetical protein
MRSSSRTASRQPAAPLQPEWRRQLEAWRELLDRCALKASRRRVHALRIVTLRLQAALEYRLQREPPDAETARAARRWDAQARKLRRALAPVRETDVYLERLASLRKRAVKPGGDPRRYARALRELDKFEAKLKRLRQDAANRLIAEIKARRTRLDRRARELEAALDARQATPAASSAEVALQLFTGLADEFKSLSDKNLHAYRKRLKSVRYLAEYSAQADPRASRLAAILRKMQDAAGDWHDWQALAEEAARQLRKRDDEGGLAPVLGAVAQGELRRALGVCRRSTARLLGGPARSSSQG